MNVDVVLYKLINQTLTSPLLDTIMVFASSKYGWLPLYLLLVFLLLKKKPLKTGLVKVLLLIAAFGISDSFTSRVVKPLFKRQRPYMHSQYEARLPLVVENREGFIEDNRKNYGFVSSHASNFFAVLTLAGILLSLSVRNSCIGRLFPGISGRSLSQRCADGWSVWFWLGPWFKFSLSAVDSTAVGLKVFQFLGDACIFASWLMSLFWWSPRWLLVWL